MILWSDELCTSCEDEFQGLYLILPMFFALPVYNITLQGIQGESGVILELISGEATI